MAKPPPGTAPTMGGASLMPDDPKPTRRPRAPKADVTEELIAAVQEAADILAGKRAPARVHTPETIAAAAAKRAARRKATEQR